MILPNNTWDRPRIFILSSNCVFVLSLSSTSQIKLTVVYYESIKRRAKYQYLYN
jgi:hypothetical protein